MSWSRSETKLIALIVASAFFMQALDSSIITTSLPQMARTFQVRALDLSIGITIYLLSAAAFVPLSGWLADRYGARNIFMLSIVVFSIASLACGLAASLPQFVVARAVQGFGGALMTPVGRLVVLRNTEKSDLLYATALITWPALSAPVIGPALGGFITTYASWRWNFLLNVPLGLAGLALVAKFVPNFRDEHISALDWPGFFLSATSLVVLLYGLESFAHTRTQWLLPATFVGIGVLLGALSVRHFNRASKPLLNLSAVKVQTYAISAVYAGTLYRLTISATPFLLPLLFQVGFGLSAWSSGILILVYFAGNLGMKPVTTPILRRFGFRRVLIINGTIAALSIIACAIFSVDTSRWLIMGVLLIAGLSRSMQFTCLNTLTFADIAPAQRSSATTLSSMLQQLATVLGVALGALLLNLGQAFHHASEVGLSDFRFAFVVIGSLSLLSALAFFKLPHDAGVEVSGHLAGARQSG